MAIKRWNANTSTWELVGTPGTVTPAAIGSPSLAGGNIFNGTQTFQGFLGIDATGLTQGFRAASTSANERTISNFQNLGTNGSSFTIRAHGANYSETLLSNSLSSNTLMLSESGSLMMGTYVTQPLIFGTNNTERIRIDSSGNTFFGMSGTSLSYPGRVNIQVNQGSAAGINLYGRSDGYADIYFLGADGLTRTAFVEGGTIGLVLGSPGETMRLTPANYTLIGYASSNGSYRLQVNSQIFATSSSIATSDGRYKENVLPITSGLDIIDSLNPVSFDWKEHPVHNFVPGKTVGFIAQEVKEALKDYEWVDNIIKTNYNEELDEEFLGIAESNIIPLLVAAVKELRAEVNTLKAQVNN